MGTDEFRRQLLRRVRAEVDGRADRDAELIRLLADELLEQEDARDAVRALSARVIAAVQGGADAGKTAQERPERPQRHTVRFDRVKLTKPYDPVGGWRGL